MRDFIGGGSKGQDWPVCSVAFAIDNETKAAIAKLLGPHGAVPQETVFTRYYDGSLTTDFVPPIEQSGLSSAPVLAALKTFASAARRLKAAAPEQENETAALRTALAEWATVWQDKLKGKTDLQNTDDAALLTVLRSEAESKSTPLTADMVEAFQEAIAPVLDAAKEEPIRAQIDALVKAKLPVLIYFENYGALDSAIYLPRFIEDLRRNPDQPKVRTINAMFRHVSLDAAEIAALGFENESENMRRQGQLPSDDLIAKEQRSKEERAIRLNSASNDISKRFSDWWSQRRHKIRYHADGEYFRIWVADDRRPDVEIELEARSKGFQWFFSFYLVFLVESDEGHKDAILLLDEPGLDLHPTAQKELIAFFETLAERNQLLYTTHSPFLIDGENLHRVRPVTEDGTGHSRISAETWPKDRETIFPLQAAAGYAMVRGLFQHKKNVLVEGMSDYYYLHALNHQCRAAKRSSLPEDIYITPCGGTKLVGQFAALFLGQDVRPVVLLDSDDAGRVRRDALYKELYAGHESAVLMLDDALGRPDSDSEIEDILGEEILLPALNALLSVPLKLTDADRKTKGLVNQIKGASARQSVSLPEGWKVSTALALVSSWATSGTALPDNILVAAAALFEALTARFSETVGQK
ncbi:ATP-dependent nuclease [Paraburkholderia sp. JPY465]|uniref:ATP-dependent nuclease n=1 Tax=Paraburkholderia sp. JPY465 TaxID=3042285 RepID=UPI003D19040E